MVATAQRPQVRPVIFRSFIPTPLLPLRPAVKHLVRYAGSLKTMTIAAGYMSSNGILLCADTEHSDNIAKYKKTKVYQLKQHLIVTGAGNSHLLKVAADRLFYAIPKAPANEQAALASVDKVIYDLHRRNIYKNFSAESQNRPEVHLIVAVRCGDGKLTLIKTENDAASLGGSYVSVGTGAYLFEYWAHHLFDRQLDFEAASYLLLFILREVKLHVSGCGGDSQVLVLARDENYWAGSEMLRDDSLLAGFPASVCQVLADCVDYPATNDQDLKKSTERFLGALAELRDKMRAKHQVDLQRRQSTKGDPKFPQPSRE